MPWGSRFELKRIGWSEYGRIEQGGTGEKKWRGFTGGIGLLGAGSPIRSAPSASRRRRPLPAAPEREGKRGEWDGEGFGFESRESFIRGRGWHVRLGPTGPRATARARKTRIRLEELFGLNTNRKDWHRPHSHLNLNLGIARAGLGFSPACKKHTSK